MTFSNSIKIQPSMYAGRPAVFYDASLLNLNQSCEELDDVYSRDFYWYLKCPEFINQFLRPLANALNAIGESVLDVGCGEGQLQPYLDVPYRGIDASNYAILRAMSCVEKQRMFECARLETYCQSGTYKYLPYRPFGTILFGNVLEVIIKADKRRQLIDQYVNHFQARYVAVYEMEHFNHEELYLGEPIVEHHGYADISLDPEVKKHRKFLIWKV